MAAEDKGAVFSTSDDASIALLRRLRAGAAVGFVHALHVCSAAPEDLVADLEPAPGTDGTWYFYCQKKYKNAQGKASGHRQRAIGGGDTCWHAEARPKQAAAAGGTACNLSYGRKDGRSFSRLGWCMVEYDDGQVQTDAAGYVLCKVYRSPRASGSKSASSKTAKMAQPSSGSKRKATGDEHPEARPVKLFHEQETTSLVDQEFYYDVDPQVQQQPLDYQTLFPAEQEQQVQVQENTLVTVTQQPQQNTQPLFPDEGEPNWEQIFQFLSQDNITFTMDELLGVPGSGEDVVKHNTQPQLQRKTISSFDKLIGSCNGTPTAMAPTDAGFSQGLAF